MDIKIEPKNIYDAYSKPIVQQTSCWSIVKERLGMHSCAFEFSVKNRDIYTGVGGFSRTNADFITFFSNTSTTKTISPTCPTDRK